MDDYLKLVLLGLSMGAGMMIIVRFGAQWFRRKPPADMAAWMDEISRASNEAIRDNLCAVQSNARLVSLVGQVPSDFDPTIFLTANIAANLQRAVLLQAEAEGLVPPGILARVYGEDRFAGSPYRGDPPRRDLEDFIPRPLHVVADDEPPGDVDWDEHGKMVPRVRRR